METDGVKTKEMCYDAEKNNTVERRWCLNNMYLLLMVAVDRNKRNVVLRCQNNKNGGISGQKHYNCGE